MADIQVYPTGSGQPMGSYVPVGQSNQTGDLMDSMLYCNISQSLNQNQQQQPSRSSSVNASLDPVALSTSATSLLPAIGGCGTGGNAGHDGGTAPLHHLVGAADTLAQLAAGLDGPAMVHGAHHQQQHGQSMWLCAGCFQPIYDQFLMQVADAHWHETCLKCTVCSASLSHSGTCFVRNSKIYCEKDYRQLHCVKCGRCYEPLSSTDYVQRSQQQAFHVRCFTCVYCGVQLAQGDEYLMVEGQIICRQDYDLYMCNSLATAQKLGEAARGKAIKRPRTILTSSQRRAFKAAFEQTSKPCRKVREQLAKDTGLSVRVVQVWFQNQRAKVKKIQRKQELHRLAELRKGAAGGQHAHDAMLSGKLVMPKVDMSSPPSSPGSDDGNFSVAGDSETADSPLTMPGGENSQQMHPQDEVRRQGNNAPCAFQMQPLQHGNHAQMGGGQNPIEQLYSMQNAYFMS